MDAGYAIDRRTRPALTFRMRTRAQVVIRAWRRFGPSTSPRLLDVGAAEGASLVEMARGIGDGDYVGLEMSRPLIEAAAPGPRNVRIVQGDACALPDEFHNQFDLVSMLAVLEHLPDPDAALSGAFGALRRGGLLVATCPNPTWDAISGRLGLVEREHHVQEMSLERLRECISAAGFHVLEARRFMWAPVAALTYLGIPVPPRRALAIDTVAVRFPLLRRLCVNAYVIARAIR